MNRDKLHKIIRWIIVLTILLICFFNIIGVYIDIINPIYELPTSLSLTIEQFVGCFSLITWAIPPFYAAVRIFGSVHIFPDGKTFSEQLWKWIGCMRKPSLSFKIFSVSSLLILLVCLVHPAFMAWFLISMFFLGISVDPFVIIFLCPLTISELGIIYTAFLILKKLYIEISRLIKPETEPTQPDAD